MGNFRQQRGVARDIEALLQRLLHAAPHDVVQRGGIKRWMAA